MNFYPLESKHNLYNGYRNCFEFQNIRLLLIQDNDSIFLIENRCPHMDWLLDGGQVSSMKITCPKHGIQFHLESGEAIAPMKLAPLNTYPIIEHKGQIGFDSQIFST